MESRIGREAPEGSRKFLVGIGRGAAGALLFGLPMLMTMELWQLGFYMERSRLLLLVLVNIPLLIALAHRVGFEKTYTLAQACRDAAIAYGLGIVMSALILVLLGDIKTSMPMSEIIGKISIQAVAASIGALLGRSQLADHTGSGGDQDDDGGKGEDAVRDRMSGNYGHELFLMAVGALFLNLNIAPTEEIILISYKMTAWHALFAIVASIAIMHAFVYAVAFKGTHQMSAAAPRWHVLVRFTLPGYVVAMAVSFFVLWLFGRLDGKAVSQMVMSSIVLSFPGAIGAAAARLIL
ncbi:TIGR02587 family membrane protein [Aliirhizobium smilacinae]|uniref:TIGR02587 family membrane protein n=1 Tax=Aliirhizobium smilacinae TaxID=1395944 RepID=A0A5C4XIR4_9HYPH|nr:TIGR02587 family membrane protein [Rhizobium smilacinae]TNM63079.1 TIGR02587 family membrane protein [Rhizobium smilacinae]